MYAGSIPASASTLESAGINAMDTKEIFINLPLLTEKFMLRLRHILIFTFVVSIICVVTVLFMPNKYMSKALLKVSDQEDFQSQSSSNPLSQITDSFGLNSRGSKGGYFAIETLNSLGFFTYLINKHPEFYSPLTSQSYNYDPEKSSLSDYGIYDNELNEWINPNPSIQELYSFYYLEEFNVLQDEDSQFILMSYTHTSPEFAHIFLSTLIRELNEYSRKKDLHQTTLSLDYLKDQFGKYTNKEVNLAISKLFENQMQKQMFASVKNDYLLEVIDPPINPERKTSPRRSLICMVVSVLAFIFSSIYFVFIELLPRNIRAAQNSS